MAYRHSDNLPEVVPDSSPQALTYVESYERRGLNEGDAKYAVVYDADTAKIVTNSDPVIGGGGGETPTSPAPTYRPPLHGAGAISAAGDWGGPGRSEAGLVDEKAGERKILGLKRRTFFIVLVIAIVIVAAAIGGGVGGSRAAKNGSSSPESAGAAEEEASSTSPTNDSNNASSTQDSSSPTPTSTSGAKDGSDDEDDDKKADKEEDDKNDDDTDDDDDDSGGGGTVADQGFDFTGWEDRDFKGDKTDIITTTGFIDLPFNVTSYKWRPNGTSCCVTMCQGKTKNVGWRCTTFDRDKSSSQFGRLFIGCGVEGLEENSRCS